MRQVCYLSEQISEITTSIQFPYNQRDCAIGFKTEKQNLSFVLTNSQARKLALQILDKLDAKPESF